MMNRTRQSYAAPSKASATTLCQKCLQKGHYSYECTIAPQSRPYVSRPSRSQQLIDPKLAPRLSSDTPNPLLRKEGVADEQLAQIAKERGRQANDDDRARRRSISSASSASVSTISTNLSRSPTPPARSSAPNRKYMKERSSRTAESKRQRSRSGSESFSDNSQKGRASRKSNREEKWRPRSASRSPLPTRNTRLRRRNNKNDDRSRSPSLDLTRRQVTRDKRDRSPPSPPAQRIGRLPSKGERPRVASLSPYSRRLALTQAMNL